MGQIHGLEIGLVTDVNDPEQQGKIKLHCPALGPQHETDWVRIASAMGGKDRGSHFLPEVGDEAVLGYWREDAALPYVLGFLWNGKDLPPEKNVHRRMLKSTSGHFIVLDDTPGKENVTIESKSGHHVKLDDASGTITVQSSGAPSIALDAKGNSITFNGGGRNIKMVGGQVLIT